MRERSTLSELARFIGGSALTNDDPAARRQAITGITTRLKPQPAQKRVTDLLGAVLALSARTRRAALPRVAIELDVFAPNGARSMKIVMPDQD